MRTLQKVAIVGLIPALLLVGLFVSGVLRGTVQESAHATLPLPPMDQWLTYTDERFHFTFRYAPDWYIRVMPADRYGGGVQLSTYDLNTTAFTVEDVPPDYLKIEIVVVGSGDSFPLLPGQTVEEWVRARGGYDPSQVRQEKHAVVAGREAFEQTVEYFPGWQVTTIFIPYHDATYGDTVLWISSTPFWQPSLEQAFRQIVSTFAFTE